MTVKVIKDHFYDKIILAHSFMADFDETLYKC
jgi:hypothetical protein